MEAQFDNECGIILETKLVADIKGDFFAPSYQREYRWGKIEVARLLDNVYDNDAKSHFNRESARWF